MPLQPRRAARRRRLRGPHPFAWVGQETAYFNREEERAMRKLLAKMKKHVDHGAGGRFRARRRRRGRAAEWWAVQLRSCPTFRPTPRSRPA